MRLGVISDIHGNRVALAAVLADMPPVDGLVCAGDVVGYNPWHADCVDAMRGEPNGLPEGVPWPDEGVPTVMGNHDRAVVEDSPFAFNDMARAGVEHARDQLDEAQLDWLSGLPEERVECDGRVKLVHGHPEDPDHYTYPEEFGPELLDDEDVLVMGHTHRQHHEVYDEGVVMNPGSVGQPRDGDHRAAYAVLDLDELTVEDRRVEYDTDEVIEAVEDAGLPRQIGFRLTQGR
ncbi:metallophosphoesterase family protein [Haloarcula nitratireducens]|uniref:Phosphoesterase n=1 Tax=Haloarcula nitratireducens TaxID=2487749 RepID=A0AAW4PED0_9EURY|nr:YfcE family phosphodiesterase [Halomicroarcula nitratireducens]MBX0295975.1 YfcE family phosphodiesterase [Halomicroarcula nitratireducens]